MMPSSAAPRTYEEQIPSFMSVFGLEAEIMEDRDTVTVVNPRMVELAPKSHLLGHSQDLVSSDPTQHKHNDSTSTQASESTDSSPTTTLSTTDSSPLSDPSPSSSPDSPVKLIPLNNYPSTSFNGTANNATLLTIKPPAPSIRPMTSPSPRRPRNMKGLSIQPPGAAPPASQSLVSEPSSPSFIRPAIPAMKRKPSQLSLKTNSSNLLTRPALEVPPSPGMPPILQRRALKHSSSSPHMRAGLKSSTFGPAGGMTFPKVLERNESGLSEVLRPMKSSTNMTFSTTIEEEESPIKPQLANRSENEPYHEQVNNEDLKSPAYPNGPIAIYGNEVFLYLEPTAEEATDFDLVINVAREVVNPFTALDEKLSRNLSNTASDLSPIPDTAVTTASFATAFEFQPMEDVTLETPTTPKANPLKRPEYMHVPWDHNTDIAPDLMDLCETIDARVKDGKKVLVHCQQGASRSASLIIAYGLYQRPESTVNDAYYAAQAKSRWISPNMKLMYCLQDFQKQVSKRGTAPSSTLRPGRSPSKHRMTLSANAIDTRPKEPQSAPLPEEESAEKSNENGHSQSRPRGNSSPDRPCGSSTPFSAPPTVAATSQADPDIEMTEPSKPVLLQPPNLSDIPARPRSGQGMLESQSSFGGRWDQPPPAPAASSFPGFQSMSLSAFHGSLPKQTPEEDVPVERTIAIRSAFPEEDALISPRVETMTNNPLYETPSVAGMHFVEPQPTLGGGLFSPRATMFPRNPMAPFGRPGQFEDPRSPPTKGETPIVRSIDDLL